MRAGHAAAPDAEARALRPRPTPEARDRRISGARERRLERVAHGSGDRAGLQLTPDCRGIKCLNHSGELFELVLHVLSAAFFGISSSVCLLSEFNFLTRTTGRAEVPPNILFDFEFSTYIRTLSAYLP